MSIYQNNISTAPNCAICIPHNNFPSEFWECFAKKKCCKKYKKGKRCKSCPGLKA